MQPAGSAPGGGAAPAGPFRWLVQTQGPQPTVAEENRHPGTTAWRLPGPRADVGGLAHGHIAGYVAREAVSPGQVERIYVSAPRAHTITISIFRMGWYGGAGGREVLASDPLPAGRQPGCAHKSTTGLTECHWRPTLSFRIPKALPSGVYIAKLSAAVVARGRPHSTDGRGQRITAARERRVTGESDCLFVVLATHPQPLLAQLPTATYEAYNAWGGDSLYPGGADRVRITGTTQGVEVSYDRPYDSVTGAGQFFARDVAMVRFLERYGYPVSYTTSESVDEDPAQLQNHRALIDFGHSEYWSQTQANAFALARNGGTSLLFLGSDTLAWRIRFVPAAGQPDHAIVAYKEHAALDPDQAQRTGAFPQGGAGLTGSAFLGCITPRVARRGPPTYRYYVWSPNTSRSPRWLFKNTGITARARIPGIVGYELDARTRTTPRTTQLIGSGQTPCMTPGPGQNVAQTTLYTVGRAIVFDTGTLGWELALDPVPSASPDAPRSPDLRVVTMTRNLLARVLTKPLTRCPSSADRRRALSRPPARAQRKPGAPPAAPAPARAP